MGGQSVSKFSVEQSEGHWSGEVKVVPFLHAPGFCTCRTATEIKLDLSKEAQGGLRFRITKVGGNLTNFEAQFSSAVHIGPKKGGYTCKFSLPAGAAAQAEYDVPFSSCKESWRGEPEGGAPSAEQLGRITQIGIGSDGVAGTFDLRIHDISVFAAHESAPRAPLPLVTFTKGAPTTYRWTDLNDPVMGGQSTSTFTVDEEHAVGTFKGVCRIVPKLKAPGFCNAEAAPGITQRVPDASAYLEGALVLTIASTGPLTSFKAAFGNRAQHDFYSWKADFNVTSDGKTRDYRIPFNHFSNKWSSYTGEPTTRCSPSHPEVCPTRHALASIGAIGIWAEGAAGEFHLEVHGIAASM